MAAQERCGLHVRCDHAFFDQAVRVVAHAPVQAVDAPLCVEAHFDLGEVDVDRAAPGTREAMAR
jgi:hypothetical protein